MLIRDRMRAHIDESKSATGQLRVELVYRVGAGRSHEKFAAG